MDKLYVYTLTGEKTKRAYDEAALVSCLQGIYNRERGPAVYVKSAANPVPEYWLRLFTGEGEWLSGRETVTLGSVGELLELAAPLVKKAIIWDPAVNASFNVAFTIAGVEDGVVLSPEYADEILPALGLSGDGSRVTDLRGLFTGSATGSAKNDAYIWAVENYLSAGKCAKHWLSLYSDPFMTRDGGDAGYVVTRDWCVYNRAFVYDLSPWGDEVPFDDPGQPVGRDLETYHLILSEQLKRTKGECMTEVTGFFNFIKYSDVEGHSSRHEPVPTEWETVYLISPYNCYQNTVASDCYNQSLHSQFPFKPLRQPRPAPAGGAPENACYLGIQMCDYDSATPLYDFLAKHWADPNRGKLPLSWGINPNLIETYPDIITHFYKTAAPGMDVFVADASAAGYFNPSRIQPRYWDMVSGHNKRFYDLTDMTISGMVLDWVPPTAEVLDGITSFSPDGAAFIIFDFHTETPNLPVEAKGYEQIHNGVLVDRFINDACYGEAGPVAERLASGLLKDVTADMPAFHYLRIVWQNPSYIAELLDALRRLRPDLDIRLMNTYQYFQLRKKHLSQ